MIRYGDLWAWTCVCARVDDYIDYIAIPFVIVSMAATKHQIAQRQQQQIHSNLHAIAYSVYIVQNGIFLRFVSLASISNG